MCNHEKKDQRTPVKIVSELESNKENCFESRKYFNKIPIYKLQ